MAHSVSDPPGFELKHRILGAIILVSVAVIAIPMILGDPKASAPAPYPEAQSNTGEESGVFVSKITPIADDLEPAAATPATQKPQADPSPDPQTLRALVKESEATSESAELPQETSDPQPADVSTTAAAAPQPPQPKEQDSKIEQKASAEATPAAETQTVASVDKRGWIVRIGTFSKRDNAKQISALLQQKGFEPVSGQVETENGPATRVWVGPFSARVEAARVQARIEDATGEKGLITAYP